MPLVTFDFHNTLAHCDSWFALEIRELPGAVLQAMYDGTGDSPSPELTADVAAHYRQLRQQVMASGIEIDAQTSVMATFATMGIAADSILVEHHIERIMRASLHDLHPVPGSQELVRALHERGFRLGVVSSAVFHPFLEWSLEQFGIAECFDFVITSASAGFYKSSPKIYEYALELAGVAPTHALHIGDSPRWDVTTANSVGMSTILLNMAQHRAVVVAIEEGLTDPDLKVESFPEFHEEILAFADTLNAREAASRTSDAPAPPKLRVDIFSLFPQMFAGPFDESILKRARGQGILDVRIHDIRGWTHDKHHTADDTPYGGGAGMVMKAQPIVEAIEDVLGEDLTKAHIAITSAGGRLFSQPIAHELAECGRLVLICGHYEGIDERVSRLLDADELSIGDYVMTGGELPAIVIVDTVARLIPGVIDAQSIADESHAESRAALVEYPHYTRPAEYRGLPVPPILLSGHHAKIEEWRENEARMRTQRWRPDLLVRERTS
ncbi:MAG: tRNA (guanosine(37)-N1)-methyltransferase TrmD [Thermomicrobiales bacterium]